MEIAEMHRNAPGSARAWLARASDLFASPLRASHYLALVNPLWATHKLEARVVAVHDDTADVRTLTLRPGRAWRRHRAGQHVRVGVVVGGARHFRTYSISSEPERDDGCLTITVKAVPGGRVSSHLARDLAPGDYLSLGLPEGDFVLTDAPRPLFITAGSGITPVMSMLRSAAARRGSLDAVHLHYAPRARDVVFGAELATLARDRPQYRLRLVLTREPSAPAESGHFDGRRLEALCPDWRGREVYACGPQPLIAALEAHWEAAGLGRRLHVERFHASWAELPADVGRGTVRFARSGLDVATDGRTSLLRLAEEAGLTPVHGCRMGICHSCDVPLLSGCVRDLRSGALANESSRTVQLCISAPAGDVAVDL